MSNQCLNGRHLDRLQSKCAIGCLATFLPALILFIITSCIYGIHSDPTMMEAADHYCNCIILFLAGMAVAFNISRKWAKAQN